jgi:hypothetical protein
MVLIREWEGSTTNTIATTQFRNSEMAYLNKKMEGDKLKKGFGFFVLAMAFIIFIEQFFFSNLIK